MSQSQLFAFIIFKFLLFKKGSFLQYGNLKIILIDKNIKFNKIPENVTFLIAGPKIQSLNKNKNKENEKFV